MEARGSGSRERSLTYAQLHCNSATSPCHFSRSFQMLQQHTNRNGQNNYWEGSHFDFVKKLALIKTERNSSRPSSGSKFGRATELVCMYMLPSRRCYIADDRYQNSSHIRCPMGVPAGGVKDALDRGHERLFLEFGSLIVCPEDCLMLPVDEGQHRCCATKHY